MKLFKPSRLIKSLTTEEKRKIRESVIPELERYRFFRELEHLTKDQEVFCRRVEASIEKLPSIERFVISKRYISSDSDYVTDYQMYNMYMDPPASRPKYNHIRNSAMLKIALFLGLDTGVDISID